MVRCTTQIDRVNHRQTVANNGLCNAIDVGVFKSTFEFAIVALRAFQNTRTAIVAPNS
jgi:hypothetical protein